MVEYNFSYFYHLPACSTTGGLLPQVMPRHRQQITLCFDQNLR
jgi:hypothetical protein